MTFEQATEITSGARLKSASAEPRRHVRCRGATVARGSASHGCRSNYHDIQAEEESENAGGN